MTPLYWCGLKMNGMVSMTREDIEQWTREAGGFDATPEFLKHFAELVASAEREACAEICNRIATEDGFEGGYAYRCVIHIRARGQA